MSEMQEYLLNIVRQIALVDLEAMEQLLTESRDSLSVQDSAVSIIDPSRWMQQRRDGTQKSAELQADMLSHLIEIRKLAGELQTLSDEVQTRQFMKHKMTRVVVSRDVMERLIAEHGLRESDFMLPSGDES